MTGHAPSNLQFPHHLVAALIKDALAEDLGLAGDITTNAIIAPDDVTEAVLALREDGCIAGLPLAEAAFRALDPGISFAAELRDGETAHAGSVIARVSGSTRTILSAERVALNLVQHLSGVATATRHFVETVHGTHARIVCTRKTTPGLRAFEKYAVRAGGGYNHRFGLFDAVLIKDNHIAAAGGVSGAIELARAANGHMVKIEVEVDTLTQLEEALRHDVDAVLLDNMAVPELKSAVARAKTAKPGILCEASGGVRLVTVRAIAETGVDMISVGALTHSVKALDIGLDF
ncbi:carboxylating nicotinate-nucleotide diphosphorylase [Rhodomicrobium udaipurense]|uniref:Probable nicotinate-nucleotide pyrophosphorylase [carboxylating] n=2 Tax=Rhodomicrobium udaipurense TaxID=1202716 RepID=A0A8I1GBE8_9HYPH|nr:carboxylating nicotinate-nucleotide diphosphorylase [Rhodomicrobium udaipurense]MBJ7543992.1 carboxylating nicotinate-nucleotide diphosphorylase [Rhodomicrobium udaipurense]